MTEILLLALLGPLALFPTPGRFVALALIPAWWAWRWLRRPPGAEAHFVPRTPLDGALLLLIFMVLVSALASPDLPAGLPKIAGLVYALGVYYAVVRVGRGPRWWGGLGALLLGGAGIAGLAVLGTRWPVKFAFLDYLLGLLPIRVAGLPGAELGFDPNEVAGTLLLVIPLTVALAGVVVARRAELRSLLGARRTGWAVWGLGGLAAFLLAVLFLTQSRTGLLACGLAVGVMLLIAVRRQPAIVLGLLAAGGVLAGAVLAIVGPLRLLQYLIGLGGGQGGGSASLYTVEGRVETWARAIYAIQDFPLTGMGLNVFRLLVHSLYPMYLVAPGVDIGHAHNLWLQAAVDLGLPGLVAYLGLWLGAAAMLWQVWQVAGRLNRTGLHPGAFARPLAAGLGGGLLAHFVFGLTDAVALGAKPGVLWWLLLGLIAGLYRQIQAEKTG